MRRSSWLLLGVLLASGCVSNGEDAAVPLHTGLGDYRLPVTTTDAHARRYFDQGLALCHGFNHDEAARSFEEAARLDPDFAMAYWGLAYALGPNYNLWDEGADSSARAVAALRTARAATSGISDWETELIDALSVRFSTPHPADRSTLNEAYVVAMRKLWKARPKSPEIGFLFADALLCRYPWDQWNTDGTPKRGTKEIQTALEDVLALDVRHPGANHLYIHTMEASHTPGMAEPSADRLGALMPGAGHIVHMPSHIYMRIGRYDDSTRVNAAAARLDREFFRSTGTENVPGIYHTYHLHNHHFLIWSAMFQGRYEDALNQCDRMREDIPKSMWESPWLADWFATKYHVLVRFGRWKDILEEDRPEAAHRYATAIWHYARGIALANLGRSAEATAEVAAFESAAAVVAKDLMIHVVPAVDVLDVARNMLVGEVAYKAGNFDKAFDHLHAAVDAETALRYTEPNPWMMPSRHALGALLLERGRVEEALTCYREDLRRYPDNGWALHGLVECLERRGEVDAAKSARSRLSRAWAKATVKIPGSCFCRTR